MNYVIVIQQKVNQESKEKVWQQIIIKNEATHVIIVYYRARD